MERVEEISKQVKKVRSKIAEYKAAEENADKKFEAVDFDADIDTLYKAQDDYLDACKLRNRIGGEIKRMTRKAMQLYYDCTCEWFKFEFASQYIREFNKTFQYWN